jgi:hypothetical protein
MGKRASSALPDARGVFLGSTYGAFAPVLPQLCPGLPSPTQSVGGHRLGCKECRPRVFCGPRTVLPGVRARREFAPDALASGRSQSFTPRLSGAPRRGEPKVGRSRARRTGVGTPSTRRWSGRAVVAPPESGESGEQPKCVRDRAKRCLTLHAPEHDGLMPRRSANFDECHAPMPDDLSYVALRQRRRGGVDDVFEHPAVRVRDRRDVRVLPCMPHRNAGYRPAPRNHKR